MRTWEMHEANARLPELVERAVSEGPQDITLHGQSVAVVLSRSAYEHLCGNKQSLVEFMRESPMHGLDDIDFEHERSETREA